MLTTGTSDLSASIQGDHYVVSPFYSDIYTAGAVNSAHHSSMELKTIALFFLLSSLVVTVCAKPAVPVLNAPEPVLNVPEPVLNAPEPVLKMPKREAVLGMLDPCCWPIIWPCW